MKEQSTEYGMRNEVHTRLWHRLSSAEKFQEMGAEVTVPKGTVIARAGEEPDTCWFVLEGRIVAMENTAPGTERYYNFNEEGTLLMEANALLFQKSPVSFMAVTDARLIRISAEKLRKAMDEDNELCREVMVSLAYKFLTAMDQVREGSQCDVNWKVCNLLLTFAERYGVPYDGKILIKEKISQQVLANLLGINRITMVRAVKELRELGLIDQVNGFYCIRDREKMKEYMTSCPE